MTFKGKTCSTHCPRHYRLDLIAILIFAIPVSGCVTSAAAELTDNLFEQHEVVTGFAKHQTVLTGFLLDSAVAELAVVHIDDNGYGCLQIYSFGSGGWVSVLDANLGPRVLFVDVANVGGRDRLLTYERGSLNWFDPVSSTQHPLVAVTSHHRATRAGEIPHGDVTRDLNADGRDDLVVSGVDGLWVFVQTEGGGFAAPLKIDPSAGMSRVHGAGAYQARHWASDRLHVMDNNRDGRSDLVFWNEDHFVVHHQDERGLFTAEAETFTTDVAFDSDDPDSLAAPGEVRRRRKDQQLTGDTTGSVLHSFTDMNGDGVADLVVFSLDIRSMFSVHSTYEVHFGAPAPDGGTVFAADVGTAIRSNSVPFAIGPRDFDHDGQVDMMFTTVKIGFLKTIGMIAGAVLTQSVPLDIDFYRMEDGIYPGRPSATRRVKTVSLGKSGEQAAHFPSVLIGDVNGDSRPDLLVQKGHEELRVFLGVPGPKLFARRPHKVAVAMPDEEYTRLVDFNRDGKQDVLMHHPSTTGPHRLTVLIAR